MYGMVSVISVQTGKVVGIEMKSEACYKCHAKSNLDENSQEYIDWIAAHGHKFTCIFDKSSKAIVPKVL